MQLSIAFQKPAPYKFGSGRTRAASPHEANMNKLTVKSPKPARFPAYTIESEAGETLATVPITASGDTHKLALAMASGPAMLKALEEVLSWNEDDGDLATNDTAFRLKNFADTVANRASFLRATIASAKGEK